MAGDDAPTTGNASVDDHSGLLSELNSHHLDFTSSVGEERRSDAFAFDPDADPDETFPQSVASGGPTPAGVILWTRVAPDVFDPDDPLAVLVATDEAFEDVVFDGVVTDG